MLNLNLSLNNDNLFTLIAEIKESTKGKKVVRKLSKVKKLMMSKPKEIMLNQRTRSHQKGNQIFHALSASIEEDQDYLTRKYIN